jgi:3-hydroxyisobutyrate dehydrogenase
MKIGFIGLGLMGSLMAKNVHQDGFELKVYNRTRSKTAEFRMLGIDTVDSPKDLAAKSDIIITMVTSGKDVNQIMFGNYGVTKSKHPGLTVIDMSTIGPTAAREIAGKLAKMDIDFLDAPVTGSTPKAMTGELTIFVGGNEGVFNRARPVLPSMGKNIHYMGPTGSGQAVKMINNQILAASIEALAEGMLLAKCMNLPLKKVADALGTAPAMSPMMNLKLVNYVGNNYPLLFSMANMSKDLKLAILETKKGKLELPVLKKLSVLYEKGISSGLSNSDFSEIIRILVKNK